MAGEPAWHVLGHQVGAGQFGHRLLGLIGGQAHQACGSAKADVGTGMHAEQREYPVREAAEPLAGPGEHGTHIGGDLSRCQDVQPVAGLAQPSPVILGDAATVKRQSSLEGARRRDPCGRSPLVLKGTISEMRVILDTNLWSSIGDEGVAAAFDDMMRARAFRVVVPPSILLEVVRTPAPEARQRIIAALYHGRHIRPPSEAESECMEMVAAVRKHRRQWMRTMADTEKVRLLNNFWTNKVWRSTLEDSQPLHESQIANMSMHEQVLRAQRQQRKYILEDRPNIRPLTALMATALPDAPESWLAGWSGQDVEPWRIENREVYWHELGQRPGLALLSRMIDTTYADWVGAFVDLSKLRRDFADFTRFWLEDAERDAFPRNWVRWAVNLVQSDLKITRGNPSDGQHSSYLVDCDLFLSADMNYISALQIVYEDAPFGLAEPRLVSGDRSVSVLDRVAASL